MLTYLSVWVRHFLGDEEGASAIEYGLIAALIAVVIVSTLLLIGPQLEGVFQDVNQGLTDATAD
ncbi:Flp family type IVb pilin [Algiphilus sp.]|uniref:Flp family type IVb pilin n=1 Tax=Algiphilus sp. TaxID=1872431 RepID=UPI0034530EF4|nr:Flp family type IVb pilin [Algiphilus sp.]